MELANKTKKELIRELEALRDRVSELEKQEVNWKGSMDDHFPLMTNSNEAIFVIFDRKLEFINDRFANLFRISPEEACNPDFNPLTLIAPESRRFIRQQYRDGCHGAYKTKQFNFAGLPKDSPKIECQTFVLFIPYKWSVAVQGTLRNITVDRVLQKPWSNLPVDLNAVPTGGVLHAGSDHLFMQTDERVGYGENPPCG